MRSSDWSSDVCSSDLYNDRTRQFLPELADAMVAGVPFETIVRRGVERGVYTDAHGRNEEWLRERLRRHLNAAEDYRSEGRRGGKACVRTCRSRWSPYH